MGAATSRTPPSVRPDPAAPAVAPAAPPWAPASSADASFALPPLAVDPAAPVDTVAPPDPPRPAAPLEPAFGPSVESAPHAAASALQMRTKDPTNERTRMFLRRMKVGRPAAPTNKST